MKNIIISPVELDFNLEYALSSIKEAIGDMRIFKNNFKEYICNFKNKFNFSNIHDYSDEEINDEDLPFFVFDPNDPFNISIIDRHHFFLPRFEAMEDYRFGVIIDPFFELINQLTLEMRELSLNDQEFYDFLQYKMILEYMLKKHRYEDFSDEVDWVVDFGEKLFILKESKHEYIRINGELDKIFFDEYSEKYDDYSKDFQKFKKHFFTNIYKSNEKENGIISSITNTLFYGGC